jgi:phosphoribosyl-ATP pyrophosphohydrolase/phosphoribosyl-AMP cyclohydrolase
MNTNISQLDWKKTNGLVPAIIQDAKSRQVLMLGYMNEESFKKTQEQGEVWFWSRSKKRLWMKGEESGNILSVQSILKDCDSDSLLISVSPSGPTCHNGSISCFTSQEEKNAISDLFEVIQERKKSMPENSYTASLFSTGLDLICEKIEEEAEEICRAAKSESKQRVVEEAVDVLYHLFVLLVGQEVSQEEIDAEIYKRRA